MKIAIIGGGASGLLCAYALASEGLDLTLFEKNEVLGRKLGATGNGRGNLANEKTKEANFHTSDSEVFSKWFYQLEEKDLFLALNSLGILLKKDYRGRYYPHSFEAKSAAKLLGEGLYYKGVKVKLKTEVKAVLKEKTGFKLIFGEGGTGFFDVVILATGGLAAPQLGATPFGLEVLEGFGHEIITPKPAIVHLVSKAPELKKLDGLKWTARLFFEGEKKDYLDEVHFAKEAISGPCAFQASIGYQKMAKKPAYLGFDFLPEFEEKAVLDLLSERKRAYPDSEARLLLMGILPEKLSDVLLRKTSLLDKKLKKINDRDLALLAETIKNFKLPLLGTRDFSFAQSTLGGAALKDFDLENFESKHIKNLYATGEVLDVCGDCGGYNLYFAWLSGLLVASAIQKKIEGEKR